MAEQPPETRDVRHRSRARPVTSWSGGLASVSVQLTPAYYGYLMTVAHHMAEHEGMPDAIDISNALASAVRIAAGCIAHTCDDCVSPAGQDRDYERD